MDGNLTTSNLFHKLHPAIEYDIQEESISSDVDKIVLEAGKNWLEAPLVISKPPFNLPLAFWTQSLGIAIRENCPTKSQM